MNWMCARQLKIQMQLNAIMGSNPYSEALVTAMRRSKSEIQRWVQQVPSLQILLAKHNLTLIVDSGHGKTFAENRDQKELHGRLAKENKLSSAM